MNTNDILKRFLGQQEARIKADVSKQGYKSNSPYVNSKQNIIQGTDQGTPITMKGVDFEVHGVDEYGNEQHMYPGEEYHFPGSQVKETRMDMAQYGKSVTFGTPEYESAYKAGQVQGKGFKPNDPNATWFGGELDEIAIKPKHSIFSLNRGDYEKANGEEAFMNEKKDAYLKGLGSNWYGASRTNFPKNVEKEIAQEYQYNKNNYGLEQLASSKGFDINKRGAWIEGLSAQERNAMVNSKYSSSLNPNEFAEALSGLQQTANTLLPGQPFDYQIPGLTPNENQEDKDSWASAFKMFAPMNIPGNYIANAAKNTNLSSHPNFRETPAMGMQRMGNVSSMESMALNPLSYEAIASVPDLAIGAYKGAKNLPETVRAAKHALLNNDVSKTFEKIDDLAYNGQTNIDLPKRDVADYTDGAAFAESTKLAPYEPLVNLEGLPADYTKKQLAAYMKEAERHKLKYCKDGDEACAKSANAITQAIWNKLETGTNYDYNSNAADAWYSKDQITKHGGETIYDHTTDVGDIPLNKIQIGDQVMMGPKYGTSHAKFDPATGLAKEQGVQHRAVVVGINNGQPMILESGYGASLQPRPLDKNLFYSQTSGNGVTSIVRPKQFVNAKNDIANHMLRSSEISRDATIEFGTSPAAQKYTDFFDKNKVEMANTLGLTQDELIQVYRSTIGIGAQETKLGNSIPSGLLNQSKITIQNMLQKAGLTPLIKGSTNAIKGLANKAFDKKSADLLDFPGSAVVEMEAHKLVSSGAFSDVRSAVNNLYETKYNKASRFTTNSTAASKGIFRQKEISQSGAKMGLRQNNFANTPEKQLTSAVSNLSDILKKIRKENPEYSFEKALDLAKLSWNSPAKAKNKDLIDFFYDGVGNPDPSTIGFDYLGKVNKRMQELVPITNVKPVTPGTIGFRLKEGGSITDQHRTILSNFLPKAQTGGIPRRPYHPSMDEEWNESYKPFGELAQEAMDVVQHLIPATRSLPSVGSAIGIAQSMYNSEDANMSDMVGLIPHPYAQVASFGLLGIEKSAKNFKNYRVQSQSGKSIEQLLFEKQASDYDSRTTIDSTAVAMPRMNSRLTTNPLSSPEFIGKNNNSVLNKQKPATKPKFESEFKPAPERETFPVAKKPSAPRQPMEILKELHAKGMVMKQNAQITTSMGEIPYAPKAQYGVDMSGKATPGIDLRMAAALKNNTDHAQLLRNMQTSNDSQTYYQGELDNVVVQQKTPHKGFWSQYGDRLREEHKDDGLLGAIAGLPLDAVAGFPQAAMMYGLSGKVQRPSEAMRMNGVEAAFADGVIDPSNLAGVGLLTKENILGKFAKGARAAEGVQLTDDAARFADNAVGSMDDFAAKRDPYMPEYSDAEFAKKAELRERAEEDFYEDGFDTFDDYGDPNRMSMAERKSLLERDPNPFPDDNWNDKYFDHDPGGKEAREYKWRVSQGEKFMMPTRRTSNGTPGGNVLSDSVDPINRARWERKQLPPPASELYIDTTSFSPKPGSAMQLNENGLDGLARHTRMHASIEPSARTHPSSFTLDNEQIEELGRMSNEGRLTQEQQTQFTDYVTGRNNARRNNDLERYQASQAMDQLFGSSVHEEESAREAAMDAYHDALANDYDGYVPLSADNMDPSDSFGFNEFRNKAALSREESIRRIEQARTGLRESDSVSYNTAEADSFYDAPMFGGPPSWPAGEGASYVPNVRNRSGMTKKEIIRKFGDKDGVIENMDPAAFEKVVVKPNGEIALHTESADVKGLYTNGATNKPFLDDVTPMDKGSYAEMFNSDLNRLNSIIAKNNKSGVQYRVKGLGENGSLRFETPAQRMAMPEDSAPQRAIKMAESSMDLMRMEIDRLTKRIGQQTTPEDIADATRYRDQNIADLERHNQYLEGMRFRFDRSLNIPAGETSWGVNINAGKWKGEVQDINNSDYFKSIPGLGISNSTAGVFSDGIPRRGSGTYESINEYLKSLEMGRVKAGFNSQTSKSRGLWENAVNKGSAFGFYDHAELVHGAMKTVVGGVGTAGAYQGLKNKEPEYQKGGSINSTRGWLDNL